MPIQKQIISKRLPNFNFFMRRYARQIQLKNFGAERQQLLRNAKVLVVGAGGLGVPVLQYLAAMGIGTIGITENDTVSITNLQRQVLYTEKQAAAGELKLEMAIKQLKKLNSQVNFKPFDTYLTYENALPIIKDFDLVIDCSDNFETRYLVNDACVILKKPFIYGALYGFEGHVSVFNFNNGPTYRCLFPKEPPTGQIPDCNTNGVLGVIPGIIGNLQALEAVKVITGIGTSLSGKLLIYDGMEQEIRKITIPVSSENLKIKKLKPPKQSLSCGQPQHMVKANELTKIIKETKDYQLIDVRNTDEYNLCSIKESINIPLARLPERLDEIDKNSTIYIICESGVRSLKAIQMLKDWNSKLKLYQVEGGMKSYQAFPTLHS
jgi:molybdopterin/thiamine biosynthesis adenylyltransferase/rhodanese-related sulfurtransferase